MVMDVRSAEFTKYAANAMLATRISFMNELANLAEASAPTSRKCAAASARIRASATSSCIPGAGYGGSCFPKDVKALQRTAHRDGQPLRVLDSVEEVNDAQKPVLVEKIAQRFGEDLAARRFALWGLAFKPNTDDMREAASRTVIAGLPARGATVRAYDPAAGHEAKAIFKGSRTVTIVDFAVDGAGRRRRARRSSPSGRNSAAPTSPRSRPG